MLNSIATPDRQLDIVRRLNTSRDWGFTEIDFPAVPKHAILDEHERLILSICLPGDQRSNFVRTVDEFWLSANIKGWEKEKAKPEFFEHTHPVEEAEWQPGVHWVALDLEAYKNETPGDASRISCNYEAELASMELLSLLLFESRWEKKSYNGFWLSGASIPNPHCSDFPLTPCLIFDEKRKRVILDAGSTELSGSGFTNPTARRVHV